MHRLVVSLFVLSTLLASSCSEKRYHGPLTPEEALESFDLDPDFTVELFAAEPLVTNPVEMVFDAEGNIFVIEMPDYPYKPAEGQGTGRIRRLIDTDGDGRIDQSTIFADSLSEGTSILPYQGGLLVTAAPDIFFMKDTTGDFRADVKEVLFTGFFKDNSEVQITNLRYGIDNWIYASNHGQAGEITYRRQPGTPALSVKGGDFRFRLDRDQFEVETGPAQFGQALNDWNHRFVTQNTLYLQQAVIPWRYLHRHNHLPSTKGVKNIGDPAGIMYQRTPPPYWRAERTRRRQEQYAEQGLDRKEYADGHFTGASGGTHYGGHTFPEGFYGNIFVGDVAGSLVHRAVLSLADDSVYYHSQRAASDQNREFMASNDPWFRPVNFSVGPDGYLYVLDMYLQHIETPVSIPDDLKEDMDFDYGKQHGRIYRIKPKNPKAQDKLTADLSKQVPADYIALLAHPSQWWRLQAQRLLLERRDRSVVPAVAELFRTHADPRVRLHALYTLEGLGTLSAELVKQALDDPHPGLREHAIILAERFPDCLPALLKKADDPSARVVLQAALSLGEFPARQVLPALAAIAEKRGDDPWFRMALLSSEAGSSPEMLQRLVERGTFFQEEVPGRKKFVEDLAYVVSSRNREGELARLMALLPASDGQNSWQLAALQGLGNYQKKSDSKTPPDPRLKRSLLALQAHASPPVQEAIREIVQSWE
ncbi:hypothetical protein GCM10027275_23230 [Rhabdobacter roseus]|uniref:Putative membrane-bound dehydrogenase-like protein n=1 Tax=Rhabdobacter roseus TaxID=1655419 RepID=A0A840TSL8_9BACT|nr:PVC-type heme-binding CxxCH protein [Rhabdobacter roseus]MBB5284263.1 putative membrane-bound dehydrogenase-like protein [Rhabdobacter roseus]